MKTLPQLQEMWPNFSERFGSIYLPEFTSVLLNERVKEELLALEWLTKRTARHEYFMSLEPRTYSYAGSEQYESKPFSPLVHTLMVGLNSILDAKFDVCFLNKYDDQHQHLGWHADDFPGMDESEPIAVVSYGAEREIWLKPQDGPKGDIPEDQKVLLHDGSLFVMPPGYQQTHFHRIPKHSRPCGWRISLTFRSFKLSRKPNRAIE